LIWGRWGEFPSSQSVEFLLCSKGNACSVYKKNETISANLVPLGDIFKASRVASDLDFVDPKVTGTLVFLFQEASPLRWYMECAWMAYMTSTSQCLK